MKMLVGGSVRVRPYAALVERLGVRDASGTALDHLRLHGADRIRLR
jgi:hypothetical protein